MDRRQENEKSKEKQTDGGKDRWNTEEHRIEGCMNGQNAGGKE